MAGTPSTARSSHLPRIIRCALAGLLLALVVHVTATLAGGNFHTVLPGQVYRSAQPGAAALERYVHRHGIRTVVNLRGCCPGATWYRDEARVAAENGVSLEDVHFSATRLPSPQSLRELVQVIDSAEGPLLFHCQQGADRTGLASALAVLLRTDATLDEGLRHLGLATGHLSFGRTGNVDRFFALYAAWLAGTNQAHSAALLRRWMRDDYCPAEGRASWELVSPARTSAGSPLHLTPGKGTVVTLRCHNRSQVPWRFEPGATAGVHLYWAVISRQTHQRVTEGRAGLLRATVAPGGSIDLALAVPGLPPGVYALEADLTDEQHGTFLALGNDPFVLEVRVP